MELFHRILQTAIDGGASDVHLKIGGPVVFRINRQLIAIQAPTPAADWMEKVVTGMVPRHLKRRLEEEREIDFSYFVPGVGRFRTNLFQQRGEYCLSMRYVKIRIPSFEELGLLEILRRLAESPRGIVLVSGSTGCGKSTTLAAMVEHINASFKKHIITLEVSDGNATVSATVSLTVSPPAGSKAPGLSAATALLAAALAILLATHLRRR